MRTPRTTDGIIEIVGWYAVVIAVLMIIKMIWTR